jgi:magnesium transporter
LDSIVDSFFPLLKEIEKEVVAIDDMVFIDSDLVPPIQVENHCEVANSVISEKVDTTQDLQFPEKSAAHTGPVTPFSSPRLTVPMVFRQFMRTANRIWKLIAAAFIGLQPTATQFTLRRIARTRKLVTLLTRLLATKSEVIAQIRKRLLTSSQSGLGNGTNRDEDVEVSIYLGDVQGMLVLMLLSKHLFASCLDHILTLQHSLAHYERMLSQSHPAYLSQLRTRAGFVRAGADKAAIYLTIVSLAVLCVQPLIGIYSSHFPGYFNTNSCYQDFYPLTSPFHKHLIPFMVLGS